MTYVDYCIYEQSIFHNCLADSTTIFIYTIYSTLPRPLLFYSKYRIQSAMSLSTSISNSTFCTSNSHTSPSTNIVGNNPPSSNLIALNSVTNRGFSTQTHHEFDIFLSTASHSNTARFDARKVRAYCNWLLFPNEKPQGSSMYFHIQEEQSQYIYLNTFTNYI